MLIFPGIFISNGRCRTYDGEKSPRRLAVEYLENGAQYLHVVDMDGGRLGHIVNEESIAKILETVEVPVQIGGGVRTLKDIEHLLNLGAMRVLIGTKAVGNPSFIKDAILNFGSDKIVVSIDARDEFVVTEGWEKMNSVRTIDHAAMMKESGVKYLCYVDASLNNHTAFYFHEELQKIYNKTGLNVIAMGKNLSIKDLEQLKEHGAYAAVLGTDEKIRINEMKTAIELFKEDRR